MLLSKNIFCAWILGESVFAIPKELIVLIVSQIKVKIKIINDRRNLLIIYDKSIGIFDSKTNKFNLLYIDWIKKVFSNFGTTHVITKTNKIYKFESRKIYSASNQITEYMHGQDRDQQLYNFFKVNEIKEIKKVYCGFGDLKIILTECGKIISFKHSIT